jgi:L-fuconolactonase
MAHQRRLRQELHRLTHQPTGTSRATSIVPERIIDCHAHFWDTRRPEHSWPAASERDGVANLLYGVRLPEQLREQCPPLVVGAVVVEAVYTNADNQWMLDMSDTSEPFVVGLVGKLDVNSPSFRTDLGRFAQHRRFVGIRCSMDELLDAEWAGAGVMKSLAEMGLQLDLADTTLTADRVAQLFAVPPPSDLRIVINHMGSPRFSRGAEPTDDWVRAIQAAGARPHTFMKVSAIHSAASEQGPPPPSTWPTLDGFLPHLQVLWECFGQDSLIYGSDWPVCTMHAPQGVEGDGPAAVYGQALKLMLEWAAGWGSQEACDNFFWRNALVAYRYDASQEAAGGVQRNTGV